MNPSNLPEETKAKLMGKLREPASPIMTQVIRVDEPTPAITKPTDDSPQADGLEQFNAKVPADLLRRARRYKADTRKTINQIMAEALAMYLNSVEK